MQSKLRHAEHDGYVALLLRMRKLAAERSFNIDVRAQRSMMDSPYADLQHELDLFGYRSVVQNLYAGEIRTLYVERGADETQACWVTVIGRE